MAKAKRPRFKINDRITLASYTPLIPAYGGKPFVGRDKVLRVSSVTGKGTQRDPWFLSVTDDEGHFWTLPPDDVIPAAERNDLRSHMKKKPKKSDKEIEHEISEFLLNSPDAERDGHTKVEFVYYIIPERQQARRRMAPRVR